LDLQSGNTNVPFEASFAMTQVRVKDHCSMQKEKTDTFRTISRDSHRAGLECGLVDDRQDRMVWITKKKDHFCYKFSEFPTSAGKKSSRDDT